jgi:hypothetical protein
VLEPGQRVNMRVIFSPAHHRDTPYQQAIPLKITSNPRGRELQCSGAGDTPRIAFEPFSINCGAILPAVPGQVSIAT